MNHSAPGLPVHHQLPVYPDSCPSSQWCHPAMSSSVIPFSSCPQSLPASESFPMSQLFAWGGQSTGVSALNVLYSGLTEKLSIFFFSIGFSIAKVVITTILGMSWVFPWVLPVSPSGSATARYLWADVRFARLFWNVGKHFESVYSYSLCCLVA